jgi:clan AA aspartic protease
MTTFRVSIQIGDLAGRRFESVDAIVDTGASFTAVPRDLLERLGIAPTRRERFRLANGEVTENDVGEARVRVAGKEGTTPVTFNEPSEPSLLGAVTLEALLLGVDPLAERLIPVEGLRISRYSL